MSELAFASTMEATVPEWQKQPASTLETRIVEPRPFDETVSSGGISERPVFHLMMRDTKNAVIPRDTQTSPEERSAKPISASYQPSFDQETWKDLIDQRQKFLQKKFGPGLARQEQQQLQFLEWKLNRLEMARARESLNRIESIVARQEAIAAELCQAIKGIQRPG